MNPTDFIAKHITDALVDEGFPAEIARRGLCMVLITTDAAHRPVEREACSLTVFFVHDSGHLVRQPWRNVARERSKRAVRARAVCFNRR
ncbi:hypothetical protein APP83_14105 [Salmonella enterica subsp. enterica serovar Oranienburg]|nr:hypothetical protein APP73_02405 [Salmonella enterica subsp. enterica serovar Oranienburg]OIW77210.1 hypothetical protein APP83_14105 [Salmonella enterica subsp. enterica serovar Oranienburg]OIW94315.1 hypothetical protein APP84_20940 [Salmonella enterica subsp. enterica serovar Oranienburg]OIX10305.1 hypothetical protein APP67_20080 [Salmonella enterica subsp. enterica serovar Oranienburg]OIX12330.1 hypothetical protein APP93_13435 [Salmonella enterica subsp. enterica serovar Oranienburg]